MNEPTAIPDTLRRAAAVLGRATRVLIVPHDQPDGDAIGSSLALALALNRQGRAAVVACASPIPVCYRFLPGSTEVTDSPGGQFDCTVFVDCADSDRTTLKPYPGPPEINIDHHPTNTYYGKINVVDPEAAAAGEIVFSLITELGVDIDGDIATCLYTAVITDTGSFRYANTTARSLKLCAELVNAGADPALIASHVFENKTRNHLVLLGRALGSLRFSGDGQVAWMTLDHDTIKSLQAVDEDSDGIVNYARLAENVRVGLLFREQEPDTIKVGFRGRGLDVSAIASRYGGGGHTGAAGCTVEGDLETIRSRIVRACIEAVSAKDDSGERDS